jgi:hypothetical protein
MLFIDRNDLKQALTSRELKDIPRDLDTDEVKDLFDTYCKQASSLVLSMIGRRYDDIPSVEDEEEVPGSIVIHTLAWAKFLLMNRVSRAPESLEREKDDAAQWLRMVSEGTIDIPELQDSTRRSKTGFSRLSEENTQGRKSIQGFSIKGMRTR